MGDGGSGALLTGARAAPTLRQTVERAYGTDLPRVLAHLYEGLGYGIYDIQVEFARHGIRMHTTTILRWLNKCGIETRPPGNPQFAVYRRLRVGERAR